MLRAPDAFSHDTNDTTISRLTNAGPAILDTRNGQTYPRLDIAEALCGLNYTLDTDGDGIPDCVEFANDLNPKNSSDLTLDKDGDGLANAYEYSIGTDISDPDTDGDGLDDGSEVNVYGSDPLNTDSDGDGLTDGLEVNTYGTSPTSQDTDGDTMPDNWEVYVGLDPTYDDTTLDPDYDNLSSLQEYQYRTFPLKPDSDGDGVDDGTEVSNGTDPMFNVAWIPIFTSLILE